MISDDNKKYAKTKAYKIEKYKEKGITLICTSEKKDTKDINTILEFKLKNFQRNKINFLD